MRLAHASPRGSARERALRLKLEQAFMALTKDVSATESWTSRGGNARN